MRATNESKNKSLKSTLLVLAALSLLSACAQNNENRWEQLSSESDSGIVRGTVVSSNDQIAKSTVALYLKEYLVMGKTSGKTSGFCTGTLVAPDVVVTAAHCLADLHQQTGFKGSLQQFLRFISVGFGLKVTKDSLSPEVKFVNLKSARVHEKYVVSESVDTTKGMDFDIAVIRLSAPAPEGFVPAKIETNLEQVKPGQKIVAAGYGLILPQLGIETSALRKVNLVIHSPNFGMTQFAFAGEAGSTCMGDSGGPAYVVDQEGGLSLLGVTSWGSKSCNGVGVFTSVPSVTDWLHETIQAL